MRNGHVVVIENHNEIVPGFSGIVHTLIGQAAGHGAVSYHGKLGLPDVVERFEGHAAGHGAVSYHSYSKVLSVSLKLHALCQTAGNGNGRAAVAADEAVIRRFLWFWKAGDSVFLPQSREFLHTAG